MRFFPSHKASSCASLVLLLLWSSSSCYLDVDAFSPLSSLTLRASTSMRTTTSSKIMASVADATSTKSASDSEEGEECPANPTTFAQRTTCDLPPFTNIMASNRAEIAVRIMRAATELNCGTVAIYCNEDRFSQHRWGADRSFLLEPANALSTPISTYLDIEQIIKIAKEANVEAIHPGYGFLSESPIFAEACAAANITFVGPTVENLERFSDKTAARQAAIEAGVPVVPGSEDPLRTEDEVTEFVNRPEIGLPVIIKAAMGGGGKGMRVVRDMEDLVPFYREATSEAKASFGDGSVFIERYVDRPRHIEVQIVGDGTGNVVHLWERDCSVQRRHQKVLEMAPAWTLPDDVRRQLHEYAVRLTSKAKYKNAGTVEFLLDAENRPYFIEVNPRIQVEHTVTEEVTGIDLVQAQIKIAAGASLEEAGLVQENIKPRGVALQCRVTTEDPDRDFAPDIGTLTLYRHSAGKGVRMDGIGYSGLTITPYFDSMIVKYTVTGATFSESVRRMKRVLQECRIRGVKTNIGFLLNCLSHPAFAQGNGSVTTRFIDENPQLKQVSRSRWDFASEEQSDMRNLYGTERLIRYLANLAVNGHPPELGADSTKLRPVADVAKIAKAATSSLTSTANAASTGDGWRHVLLEKGPKGFAKAVREHKGLLLMDTTWRDAHQSLLATRMRTTDLLQCAANTNQALAPGAFSMEMWGGATFDVSMRFLHEDPWDRLEKLREAVPDIPFQMLLRGANAVGYTNYPDNVVYKFCKQAHRSGIDVFRVFDSLNYLDNLKLGIEASGASGGVVEAAISYTGDVADPQRGKYSLDYYLELARKLVDMDVHVLAIKDMAGLLTPQATTILISALRKEHPDIPIHVHTHDTAGNGVASMLAAAEAGADVVDTAIDAMSGTTSQPSMGAVVANFRGTERDTGLDLKTSLPNLNAYWENLRGIYLPFESGQLSGSSDVYFNEIPGGQYTNLLFQSKQLGLAERWPEIKRKYALANVILGDIPKVTPSSKVVGDLAQFMVSQNWKDDEAATKIVEEADTLALPDSVVQYLRGNIGIPPGGFPEPLRSKVLKSRGLEPIEGRPGKSMKDFDFAEAEKSIRKRLGTPDNEVVSDKDLLAYALYPEVYLKWKDYQKIYGDVGIMPTHLFLNPLKLGEEVGIAMGRGKDYIVKLVAFEDEIRSDGSQLVLFELNGEPWYMPVHPEQRASDATGSGTRAGALREKSLGEEGQVGSPMPGVVVAIPVAEGDEVKEGDTVATLSAMKMESNLPATATGRIKRILIKEGDKVDADDLLVEIESEP